MSMAEKVKKWDDEARPWKLYYLVSYADGKGRRWLLYVGITSTGLDRFGYPNRWAGHQDDADEEGNAKSGWWGQVDLEYSKGLISDHSAATKSEAEEVEQSEIFRLKPRFNIAGHSHPFMGRYKQFKRSSLGSGSGSPDSVRLVDHAAVAFVLVMMVAAALMAVYLLLPLL